MAFFDDPDEFMTASKVFFLDTNLSSPVLYTEIYDTRDLIQQVKLRSIDSKRYYAEVPYFRQSKVNFLHKLAKVREWTVQLLSTFSLLSPYEYGKIEKELLSTSTKTIENLYIKAQSASVELEEALKAGLKARGLPVEEIEGTARSLMCPEAAPYRTAYEGLSNLFARAESRVKTSPDVWTLGEIGSVRIWINAKNALIQRGDKYHYSSLNQVLMLKDKIATRFMMLEHVVPLGLPVALVKTLLDLYQWQDSTLETYGNQSYNLLKAVEPMFKTWLSHNVDNIFGNDTAYTRMIEKMKTKEDSVAKALMIPSRNLMKGLYDIVESVKDIRSIVEMFGCLKTSGHPLIDAELGGMSAAEAARSADRTNLTDSQNLRNTFCHIVLVSYIKQHGTWPKLFHAKPSTMLKKLNDLQARNITRASYSLTDWNTTEWTKIFDFDYFPNFLDLMDDKSISLYKSDKHLSWDRGKKPQSNRRLLLECLERQKVDVRSIVEKVSTRNIPEDWKIVSLYPKEREFKLEPRMFAMLVLEMRCFFTAIESNIASSLFKYLPQQTMTKTKTQNQERFLKFTDPQKNKIDYTLFLEIDLTRWNLKWREMAIHSIGHDLNCMFGVKGTFTVTHWFFTQAQIVVRVPGLRPEGIDQEFPPQTNLAWRDHRGGFEGLNQKLWTAATYAMVEMALAPLLDDNTISEYEVIGQGDNQVVRVSIPNAGRTREDIIPEVRDKLNIALESTCASVNQEVKPEENIESTSVLTYSKDVLVRGVEYPTSLKKHSRLFPVTSLDFPSVTGNTRAILAGSVAGGENALYPLRSAIIGHYHAYRYLLSAVRGFSIHGSSFPNLSHRDLQAALVIPSSVGGLCGPAYASYFYKGGSDPLGKEISGLRFLSESTNGVSQLSSSSLKAVECKYHMSTTPNLETLIDNPYGLPLETGVSPLSKVGHLTLEAFRGQVKNTDVSTLLKAQVTQAEKTLRQDLITMNPFNPILAHDLFEASGFGSVKLMRKMFIHTRTIQSVAQINNPLITHTFLRADLNEVLSFKSWVKGLPTGVYSKRDSYDIVVDARRNWGVHLHGVTNHQPLDYVHYVGETTPPSSVLWSAHSSMNLLNTRGPLTGYIGTATREKRSEHGYKIVDTGTPSRSLMKLQLIRSQAYGSKNFNELLDQISLTRSPVPLSVVTDCLQKVVGGSISHRYSSSIRSMSASYVGPLNFATHLRIDTDNINKVSGSALNYPVMLQEFIIMAQSGAKLNHLHRRSQSGGLHVPFDNLTALVDDALDCQPTKFIHQTIPKSSLSYSGTLSLKRTLDTESGSVPNACVVPPVDYELWPNIRMSLVSFFTSTLKDQNRAKTIADNRGHASLPARYQLDVSEAHAIGPMNIVRAIAHAITLITIRDTFRTMQLHPERWDESLFLIHNIEICVKACGSYLNHPLFYSHKDYPLFRYSSLKYAKSLTLSARMVAAVRRELSLIHLLPDHDFWSSDIPVFAGENKSALSDAIILSAARSMRRLFLIGHPRAVNFSSLFSGYLRVPKAIANGPGVTLELIRLRCTQLSAVYKRQGDEILSKTMSGLAHLKGVRVFNDDQKTVLRHARSMTPNIVLKLKGAIRKHFPSKTQSVNHCKHCSPAAQSTNVLLWDKYKRRKNGGESAAGYTWIHLLPDLLVKRTSLIVGNGNGGLADLLLTCFNTNVVGLDLETDMPRDTATLLNYVPVGIQLENRTRFIQSDWSINSTGDWTDETVRQKVLSSLPELSSVFIDVTGPSPTELLPSILDSMSHSLVSSVCVRLIGEDSDVWQTVDTLRNEYEVVTWVISRSMFSLETIALVSRSKQSTHTCTRSAALIHLPVTDEQHALIPERWNELLEAATLSVFKWEDEPLEHAVVIMRNLCSSLLNKKKSNQLLYADRYSLMIGYATVLAAYDEDPILTVRSWIAEEVISTDLFSYGLNSKTITHLLRYVARLTSHQRSSQLV
ncbi:RNA dependent RNA polymerase [Plasmopara viticola lesion associated mononegaambi virus 5]|uniref:RNA-directed RNA polymerase n=1 Tax=Plasmopara viticola lesion associated mononegaambi virus 5 TaxID=2692017 RepID=A0A6B9Q484_9MONO|nr:RNA dependent RNA polymerase [Plasmopara viticola lesion associated mononegaambi virus 5]QHD64776.1 RNA dependent RNA polymerase [Plasmopara viticola lesion associated mononegaambi virus 5]